MDGTLTDKAFLHLLARDAPAEDFDEPLRAAIAENASPQEIEELERSKALALRVRRTLEHRRRREIELEALFETAGDLAGLQAVDAVLNAIVRRARTLLHTDVAYLMLIDPQRGDTYMRATAGVVAGSFQRVRLAMGAGLGGLVADTSTPYATDDYAADQRFNHVEGVDNAVADEGLVAILGVPLLLGPQVLGVLFAADRSKRPFARDEVSLLCSLAAHAAISIDSARLLEEARAAVRELDAANTLVRRHSAAVERAAGAHDRFADLALRGGGVDEVAAAVTEVLGGELTVVDPDGRCGSDDAPRAWLEGVRDSRTEGRAVCRDGIWFAAVVAGSEAFGALVLRGRADLEGADQRVLERAALVTALLQLMNRTAMETENRIRGELITDLVANGERSGDALKERARQVGFNCDGEFVVVVAETGHERLHRLAFAASHLATQTEGVAGLHQDRAVLLLPGEDPGAAARRLAKELAVAIGQPVTVGAAGPVSGPSAVPAAHAEAQRCLDALTALGRAGDGTSSRELGFMGLLLGEAKGVEGFVTSVLGPVIEYDERRGTGLLQTLETYFANGGNLTRAKDDLHVHVNTVAQRLDRVAQLLGADWQQAEPALEIQLALRLHRLLRS